MIFNRKLFCSRVIGISGSNCKADSIISIDFKNEGVRKQLAAIKVHVIDKVFEASSWISVHKGRRSCMHILRA